MTIKRLIGSAPSQISRNRDLGTMAFQNKDGPRVDTIYIDAKTSSPAYTVRQNGVVQFTYLERLSVPASSTANVVLDLDTYGLNDQQPFMIEVSAAVYGNSGTGPGVFKAIYGGWGASNGGGNTVVIANSITAGTWTFSTLQNYNQFILSCSNTSTNMIKWGPVEWKVTANG